MCSLAIRRLVSNVAAGRNVPQKKFAQCNVMIRNVQEVFHNRQ